MAKDKYEFIKEILENKKLTPNQREKVLLLVKDEIKKDAQNNKDLDYRIIKIEEKLALIINESDTSDNTNTGQLKKINFINPNQVYKFLFEYNSHDLLKYTCHLIDDINKINRACDIENYDFEKHLDFIKKSYLEIEKKFFVHYSIKTLLRAYLFGENFYGQASTWGEMDKVNFSWSSKELKQWSINHYGLVPNPELNLRRDKDYDPIDLPTPFVSNLTGQNVSNFGDLNKHFKNLIHIRGDNTLRDLLIYTNRINDWESEIDFNFSKDNFKDNFELFTNVDRLLKVYNQIIRLVIEVKSKFNLSKPSITLEFYKEDNSYYFNIHHINTYYKKIVEDAEERPGESITSIQEGVNGLCAFFIKAEFEENKFGTINYWNGKPIKFVPDSDLRTKSIRGVKYCLKFTKE